MVSLSSRLCIQSSCNIRCFLRRGLKCDRQLYSPTLTFARPESTKTSIFSSIFGGKKKEEEERRAREEEEALRREEEQFEREMIAVILNGATTLSIMIPSLTRHLAKLTLSIVQVPVALLCDWGLYYETLKIRNSRKIDRFMVS
jgi:hypothetical protein